MKLHEELKEAADGVIRADADLLRRAAEYVEKCEGQEPVAWVDCDNGEILLTTDFAHPPKVGDISCVGYEPFYSHPSPPQSEEIAELRCKVLSYESMVADRYERIAEMERQLSSSAQDDTDEPTDEMLRAAMLVHAMIPDERTFDEHQNSYRMIYKAMRSLAPAVVGMQLVPVELTDEIADELWPTSGSFTVRELWENALKAARGES